MSDRCRVAFEETYGQYSCTREPGHDGPCAAWPVDRPDQADAEAFQRMIPTDSRWPAYLTVAAGVFMLVMEGWYWRQWKNRKRT